MKRQFLGFFDVSTWRRQWFRPYTLASLLLAALVVGLGVSMLLHEQRYHLGTVPLKLIGKPSANAQLVKVDGAKVTYDRAAEEKGTSRTVTVSQDSKSAGGNATFKATLDTASHTVVMGDNNDEHKITFKPQFAVADGRAKDGHVIYPTAGGADVYTFEKGGVKEDIILDHASKDDVTYSWKLDLADGMEARLRADGSVGVYTGDPRLFGNTSIGDERSGQLLKAAREKAAKDMLVYVLPRPVIAEANGTKSIADIRFGLAGSTLTLTARNLLRKHYPLSLDPTTLTSTADFLPGLSDGNIMQGGTADQINGIGTAGQAGADATAWSAIANMPSASTGMASAVYNGYVYISGGYNGTTASSDISYAALTNGSIGTWTTNSGAITNTRYNHGMVIYNGYLYVLGGWDGTNYFSDVRYVKINSNGSLALPFATTTALPLARQGLSTVVNNGHLYVIGGQVSASTASCKKSTDSASTYCDDVIYAAINGDGTIGTWGNPWSLGNGDAQHYTTPRTLQAAVVGNNTLYVMGGQITSSSTTCKSTGTNIFCDDIQQAKFNADGTLQAFVTSAGRLTAARSGFTAVYYESTLFVFGGLQPSSAYGNNVTYCLLDGTSACSGFASSNTTGNFSPGRTGHVTFLNPATGYVFVGGGLTSSGNTATAFSNHIASVSSFVGLASIPTSAGYFQYPRDSPASVAFNGYLYVLGGYQTTADLHCVNTGVANHMCNDVQYAVLNADGTVQAFTTSSNYFSVPRAHLQVVVAANGYMYLTGGDKGLSDTTCRGGYQAGSSSAFCNDTQYAAVNLSTGDVGQWKTGSSYFNFPRRDHAMYTYNNFIYVVAGEEDTTTTTGCAHNSVNTPYCDDVQYVGVNADGSLTGSWTGYTSSAGSSFTGNPIVHPRSTAGAAIWKGYMYLSGGGKDLNNTTCKASGATASTVCSDTQYAAINTDGSVGTWTVSSKYFTTPRQQLTMAVANGTLYIAGGANASGGLLSDIQDTNINSDHTLGGWASYGNITTARRSLFSAALNDNIYFGGGYAGSTAACKNTGTTSTWCNDVQSLYSQYGTLTANYERVVDIGSTAAQLTTMTYNDNDTMPCGAYLEYATAGSNGVFGAPTAFWSSPSYTYSLNVANVRYIWFKFGFDDQLCGTTSAVTDITFNYNLNSPPDPPTLVSPTNAQTGVGQSPSFQLRTTDSQGNYLQYKIYICSTSNCSSVVATADQSLTQAGWTGQDQQSGTAYTGAATLAASTMATYTYTGSLTRGSTYYWKADALDPGGSNTWSADSAINSFTVASANGAPSAPVLSNPASGATGITVLPIFQLSAADPDSDYLQYKFDLCADSACSSVIKTIDESSSQTGWSGQNAASGTAYTASSSVASSTLATYSLTGAALSTSTQYWWRGYAKDPAGTNTWSPASSINTFTTGSTGAAAVVKIVGGTRILGGTKLGN